MENIYAAPGTKIMYTGASQSQIDWGNNDDPRELLIEGKVYTIEKTEVHSWHTKVSLVEFPGKQFPSGSFDDIEEINNVPG